MEDAKKITWNSIDQARRLEIFPGVYKQTLWRSPSGSKALFIEIEPNSRFLELDVHEPGPEEVFVVEGVFNDGVRDYEAGSFIHNPRGSSHWPQSKTGCKLFVFFPEG